MGLFMPKTEFKWTVNTLSGEHNVFLKMKGAREPMDLFLDNRRVETIKYTGKAIIPSMEYNFSCGDERLTLVLHGSKVDIVYNGMFVNKKTKYQPNEKLSAIYRIFIVLLAVSAVSQIYLFRTLVGPASSNGAYFIALAMIMFSTVISYNKATSPFLTRNNKAIWSFMGALWSWIVTFLVILVLGHMDLFLKLI